MRRRRAGGFVKGKTVRGMGARLAALLLLGAVGCGKPAPVREILPETATQPGAKPPPRADLQRALTAPLPSHDQRPPWQVFLESNFYHDSKQLAKRVWYSSMVLGSTYLPQIFSEPAEEREVNPMLKAKALQAGERREAHREAQARRARHHR